MWLKNLLATTALVAPLVMSLGCASMRSAQDTRTTAPPPGPVATNTSSTNSIPAGTEFTVRTNEDISSTEANRTFQGELAQDIVNTNNQMIASKGSPVTLTVYSVDSGGTVGTKTLEVGVSALTIGGKQHTVATNTAEQRGKEGLGANQRTAEHVGAGAVLGTVIGAIAGGGSGAAIGAAVGAAGGAATQVITRGKEVRIPAETVLTFRVGQPINLTAD